jgi:hypothetical protein
MVVVVVVIVCIFHISPFYSRRRFVLGLCYCRTMIWRRLLEWKGGMR